MSQSNNPNVAETEWLNEKINECEIKIANARCALQQDAHLSLMNQESVIGFCNYFIGKCKKRLRGEIEAWLPQYKN